MLPKRPLGGRPFRFGRCRGCQPGSSNRRPRRSLLPPAAAVQGRTPLSRRMIWLGVMLLLLVSLVGWWTATGGPAPGRSAHTALVDPPDGRESPELHGSEPSVPESPVSTVVRVVRVYGVIEHSAVGDDPISVSVTAILRGEERARVGTVTTANGEYSVEVPAASLEEARDLEIRAEHARHLAGVTRVAVTRSDGALPDRVRADVRLVVATVATGRVVDGRGEPVEGVVVASFPLSPARLAAHMEPRAMALGRPSDTTSSGSDGGFSIRLLPGRENIIATIVRGATGGAVHLSATSGQAHRIGELVVREGGEIAGSVRTARDFEPLAQVEVTATLAVQPEQVLRDGAIRLVLERGLVFETELATRSREDGTYVLAASARRPHEVGLPAFGGGSPVGTNAMGTVRQQATPPATGVNFKVSGATVRVEVFSGGRPVGGARVGNPASPMWRTSAEGVARYRAPANRKHWIGVSAEGYLFARRQVEVGPTGTETLVRFELQSLAEVGGAVAIRLVPEFAQAPDECGVAIMPSALRPATLDLQLPHVHARQVVVREHTAAIDALEPGSRRLVIRPGSGLTQDDGYYLPHEVVVDVRARESLEVRVPLLRGGRLRVAARGPDGGFIPASCAVLDEQEEPSAGAWRVLDVDGAPGESAMLRADAPTDRVSPLAPGRYRLRIWHRGFQEASKFVQIRAGATTAVEVDLTPIDR